MAKLYEYLIYYRDNQSVMMMDDVRKMAETDLEEKRKAELLTREEERIWPGPWRRWTGSPGS